MNACYAKSMLLKLSRSVARACKAAPALLLLAALLPIGAQAQVRVAAGMPIDPIDIRIMPTATLTVSYSPGTLVAGDMWVVNWSSTDATSVGYSCTAAGTGYNASGTVGIGGSLANTASSAWIGYPSTCIWTAYGTDGQNVQVTRTMTTVPAVPTIAVSRSPSPMTAGQGYTLSWSSTGATSVSRICTASGTGFTANDAQATSGSATGTASSAWVNYPSTCTWTASGPGGSRSFTETMTTNPPPATISVSRSPSTMTAGQGFTLSWSSTNATSVSRVCSASGTGFTANDAQATSGSVGGTASSAWVNYPSTCTWTASGPGGSGSFTETMTTIPPPATISVTRSPSPMTAGQGYTLSWSSTDATSVSRVCTASGSGFTVNDAQATSGSATGTASSAWVNYPSTCTWTASGPGGSRSFTETMTTNPPPATISVTRSPSPMTAGQGYTLSWSSTNATSVTRVCAASGTGFTANDAQAISGSSTGTASSAWVNYPSTCTWTASGPGGSGSFTETMSTNPPPATISVTRSPSPMTAGQGYTLSWSSTDATSVSRVCTASGTGFTANDAQATSGSSTGTASSSWVNYPSTCTWTASGPGGARTFTETMTTNPAPVPPPTIAVTRTPSPMTAGQPYTLSWSSTDATSVTRVCASSGTGYTVNDAPATSGSATGSASSAWVGFPSTCTWTASGPSGSRTFTETMTTNAAPATDVITYIHTDALGSPVARTAQNGQALGIPTRYEPYGLTAAGVEPTIGFTGHVNDADTGLVYMQQRYYDPVAGRFLSVDPVTTDANTGSSFNRYAYGANSPFKYIDPDGREVIIGGSDSYKKTVTADIAKISSGKNGAKTVDAAKTGISKLILIVESKSANATGYKDIAGASTPGKGSDSIIEYNPSSSKGGKDANGSTTRPAFVGLAHELGHGIAAAKGERDPDKGNGQPGTTPPNEKQSMQAENGVREDHKLPTRPSYYE